MTLGGFATGVGYLVGTMGPSLGGWLGITVHHPDVKVSNTFGFTVSRGALTSLHCWEARPGSGEAAALEADAAHFPTLIAVGTRHRYTHGGSRLSTFWA